MKRLEPTDVEIIITADGQTLPQRFTWHGSWLNIGRTGRQWSDDEGEHWLVMAIPPGKVFDLIRTSEGHWLAGPATSRPAVV
jgi:hypothetical protein